MSQNRVRRALAILCLLLLAAVTGCMPGSSITETPPADLATPRIVTGPGFVTRGLFAANQLSTVSDMVVEPATGHLRAAGLLGAAVFGPSGKELSSVAFSTRHGKVSIVPLDSARKYEYLTVDQWRAPSTLIDELGRTTWTGSSGTGVDDACAADILGTGAPQVVVSYNGGGGVSLFAGGSSPVWNAADGNNWHVEAYRDGSASGPWRIVHSNAGGKIVVLDKSGCTISRSSAPAYLNTFSLCHWPSAGSPQYILFNADAQIDVIKLDGTIVASMTSPESSAAECVKGCPVRIKPGRPDYFAIIAYAPYPLWGRAVLSIFDPKGKMVYEEVLPESCASLAVLPATSKSRPETLLVGGTNNIWRY